MFKAARPLAHRPASRYALRRHPTAAAANRLVNPPLKPSLARTALRTPLGWVQLEATAKGLCRAEFSRSRAPGLALSPAPPGERRRAAAHLARARRQLREYFRGRRTAFDLPLDLRGTPLQLAVWRALLAIPFGKVIAYGELARRLGRPHAARAVGTACGCNPIVLIVPCHRVIGSDGRLHGYGGGLWRKRALLEWERGTSFDFPS